MTTEKQLSPAKSILQEARANITKRRREKALKEAEAKIQELEDAKAIVRNLERELAALEMEIEAAL